MEVPCSISPISAASASATALHLLMPNRATAMKSAPSSSSLQLCASSRASASAISRCVRREVVKSRRGFEYVRSPSAVATVMKGAPAQPLISFLPPEVRSTCRSHPSGGGRARAL